MKWPDPPDVLLVLVDAVDGLVVGDEAEFAVCAKTGAAASAETSAVATRREDCFMAFTFVVFSRAGFPSADLGLNERGQT